VAASEGQGQSRAHQPQLSTKGLSVNPAVFLFGWRSSLWGTVSLVVDKIEMERTVIQRRVANFKAHQERFEREREEYFTTTLAKARATQ
jgi:hypothetical protein